MKKVIIFVALIMSLGPGIGMVWVFYRLVNGVHIVPDSRNFIELICATGILVLLALANILFIKMILKGGDAKQ